MIDLNALPLTQPRLFCINALMKYHVSIAKFTLNLNNQADLFGCSENKIGNNKQLSFNKNKKCWSQRWTKKHTHIYTKSQQQQHYGRNAIFIFIMSTNVCVCVCRVEKEAKNTDTQLNASLMKNDINQIYFMLCEIMSIQSNNDSGVCLLVRFISRLRENIEG